MAFMVCHMEKFSEKDIQGIGIHNERKTENSKNEDIDYSRTPENTELHEELNSSYIAKVNKIIDNGYTSDRKIRENTVKMVSFVVSASPDYINNLEKSEQEKYFKESYNYLAEKVGKSNIVSAKVHYDEKTPHMHFCSVPLTKDGRLSAKELFDRNALKEIQNNLHTHLKSKGFDLVKGEKKEKVKHLDSHKFKAQEIKSAILEIEKEISGLEKNKKDLEKKLENNSYLKNSDTFHIQKYEAINKSKGVIFKEKAKTILVPEEEMRELIDIANSRIYAERDIKNLEIEKSNLEAKLENSHDFDRVSMNLIDSIEFNKKNLSKEKYQEFLEMTFNPMINNKPEQIQKNICEAFVNAGNKIKKDFAKNTDFVNDLGQILIKSVKNYEKNKELKNAKEKIRYKNLGINR